MSSDVFAPTVMNFSALSPLPPGLTVSPGDGTVKGTVAELNDPALLQALVDNYDPDNPSSVSITPYITATPTMTTPSSMTLGDAVEIVLKYDPVIIQGFFPTPGGPVPVVMPFSIVVRMNWDKTISKYKADNGL